MFPVDVYFFNFLYQRNLHRKRATTKTTKQRQKQQQSISFTRSVQALRSRICEGTSCCNLFLFIYYNLQSLTSRYSTLSPDCAFCVLCGSENKQLLVYNTSGLIFNICLSFMVTPCINDIKHVIVQLTHTALKT